MIVFDLECSRGHLFEGWFDSHESFEDQKGKKLVCCPYCDDLSVRRVMSPVALKKSLPQDQVDAGPIDYRRLAKEVVDYVQKNFEDVGTDFATEALKMHYEVTEKRNIRGSASLEEEKMLKEEGIDFMKIPVLKENDKKN
jgi:hypothetical protein